MNWETVIAGSLIVFSAILILLIALIRRKKEPAFRQIQALNIMQKVLDQSVEEGTRSHVSLGKGNILSQGGFSGYAGLSTLNSLASLVSKSDLPPVATSGDPGLSILSQDVVNSVFHQTILSDVSLKKTRLTGVTPFSYAAGIMPIVHDQKISTNVLIGNFGVEAGLILDNDLLKNRNSIAATNDLTGQSVMFASTETPLIGEDLFAVSEYLQHKPIKAASLTVQDILRWAIIITIITGSILKLGGVL